LDAPFGFNRSRCPANLTKTDIHSGTLSLR
jgi:hypothetical protein